MSNTDMSSEDAVGKSEQPEPSGKAEQPEKAASSEKADQPELKRAIGPKLLLFFIIGDVLGTGIYALTGKVSGEVGGAIWAPFLLAFVVALLTAGSYVELVGKYPKAAGAALYTNKAFGIHFLTFMVAFAVMSSGLTSASAAARAFGGDYLKQFVEVPTVVVAVGFIIVVALVNFRGVAESVKANVVLTTVELTGLLLVLGIGVWALLQGDGEPSRLTEFEGDGAVPALVISGAALAFYAFVGFEDSVNMAEEVKNPSKIFPKALFLGLCITGLIYISVALTSSLLVAPDVLADSDGPLLEVVKEGWPGFPLKLFSLIALFAVTNSALINMLMASRLLYGMSNERILPSIFGTVHPFRRTPWVAIVFTTALAVLLVVTGDVADLGGTTSLLLLCVFTVVNVAVLVLRREKVEHKHFRVPTVIPILGAITCAYLASPLSGRDAEQYRTAAILLVIGIALYGVNYLFTRRPRKSAPAEKPEAAEASEAKPDASA